MPERWLNKLVIRRDLRLYHKRGRTGREGGRGGRRESFCLIGFYHLEGEPGLDAKHPRAAWRRERCQLLTIHRARTPLISGGGGFWWICFSSLSADEHFASWSSVGFLREPSSLWSLSMLARGHSSFLLLPRNTCSPQREPASCHTEPDLRLSGGLQDAVAADVFRSFSRIDRGCC